MKPPFRTPPCDVMNPDCPARALLSLLADKWSLLLIHALSEGPARTGALRRRVGGISEKMLVQTLRRLETAQIVSRHAFNEVPPRVEYRLTEHGWSISPVVTALDAWVEEHALEISPAGTGAKRGPSASGPSGPMAPR